MSIYSNINSILTESIVSRYTSTDKPIGILLSGGFDSCIITSILIEYMKWLVYSVSSISFGSFENMNSYIQIKGYFLNFNHDGELMDSHYY